MIENNVVRKSQSEKRIELRNSTSTLINVISEGTSCSKFEAEVIAEKAKEVYRLGGYGDEESVLQPGQMIWKAIDAEEPPGKPLSKCAFKTIRLTVHCLEEDREIKRLYGNSAKRGQQILRMCTEAFDQGALLTQEDLGILLDCNERTVRNDQKDFQKKHNLLIPTRGNKCDIGPGVTHREKVIELFIQGLEAVDIARQLQHSLKAVERYIDSYCRVVFCQQQVRNTMQTALITGCSMALVHTCLGIHETHCTSNWSYRDKLDQIEARGSAFWEAQDAKKKPGHRERTMK